MLIIITELRANYSFTLDLVHNECSRLLRSLTVPKPVERYRTILTCVHFITSQMNKLEFENLAKVWKIQMIELGSSIFQQEMLSNVKLIYLPVSRILIGKWTRCWHQEAPDNQMMAIEKDSHIPYIR